MGAANNKYVDVVNKDFIAGTVTVGTTQVKACVGVSNLNGRQELNIYIPPGSSTIYYGPSGVTTSTGIPIGTQETLTLQYGPDIDVYLIAATSGNTAVLHEAS